MIAEIVEKLQQECPSLAGVGEEVSLTRHLTKPPASPYAWVHSVSDSSGRARLASGRHSQRTETTFGVLIYIGIDPVATDGSAAKSLEEIRSEIRTALCGYQITADHEPIEHQSGDLADLSAGVLFWSDLYTTATTN
jgi:hypothetical protein